MQAHKYVPDADLNLSSELFFYPYVHGHIAKLTDKLPWQVRINRNMCIYFPVG